MSENLLTAFNIPWWRGASRTAPRDSYCQGCVVAELCQAHHLWCNDAIEGIMAGQEWKPPTEWPKLP